jgi:hypothetical protein
MSSQYCNLCGRPLQTTFVTMRRPASENVLVLCEACAAVRVLCSGCGQPLGPQHDRLSDDRPVCALCRVEAIDNHLDALLLYERVIDTVVNALGLCVHLRPALLLCGHADMQRLQCTIHRPTGPGAPQGQLLGAYIKLERRRQIAVETGLPCWLMIKVVAHEYAHAWQGENCPFLNDEQLSEGFCEWVAYKVLAALDCGEAAEKMRRAPGFYGDATRRVLAIEADTGVSGVLGQLRAVHPQVRAWPSNSAAGL